MSDLIEQMKNREFTPEEIPAIYKLLDRGMARIEELEAQATEYRSQLRDIRNAALPDPYDERDMSVEWLQALIMRVTPPPEENRDR